MTLLEITLLIGTATGLGSVIAGLLAVLCNSIGTSTASTSAPGSDRRR